MSPESGRLRRLIGPEMLMLTLSRPGLPRRMGLPAGQEGYKQDLGFSTTLCRIVTLNLLLLVTPGPYLERLFVDDSGLRSGP